MNMQYKNVGNRGDIAKHMAWVTLLKKLRDFSHDYPIVAVDTHAFVAKAPLGQKSDDFTAKQPDGLLGLARRYVPDYYQWEKLSLAETSEYLCSPALTVRALEGSRASFVWSEKDHDTRETLGKQLDSMGWDDSNMWIAEDAMSLHRPTGLAGAVGCLFDPFAWRDDTEDLALWNALVDYLRHVRDQRAEGFVLMYQHVEPGDATVWPAIDAQGWYADPIATWSQRKHRLAVYTTQAFEHVAREQLLRLGWTAAWTIVGVDLAWGNGDTGLSVACSASQRPVKPQAVSNYKRARQQIIDASERGPRTLVCVDAPLRCPKNATSTGRGWEQLFEKIGRRPLQTSWEKFETTNGHDLQTELARNGFKDLADSPQTFVTEARGGKLAGRYYVECYPNPTIRAIGGQSAYKSAAPERGLSLITDNLEHVRNLLPMDVDLPSPQQPLTRAAVKNFEDRFDSLVCLLTGFVACGVVLPATDTWLGFLGGTGQHAENGGLLTLLSESDWKKLFEEDDDRMMYPLVYGGRIERTPQREKEHDGPKKAPPKPTEQQRAIIECTEPLVRVVARAGTGKTTVSILKARRILERDQGAHVLMLTFTRAAADEMTKRFQLWAPSYADRFRATTFHGFATQSLQASDKFKGVEFLNEFGMQSVLEWFAEQRDTPLSPRWQSELSKQINTTDPGDRSVEDMLVGQSMDGVWRELLAMYREEHLSDFDTLMVDFEHELRTNDSFAKTARGQFTHFIIDEFQDTNIVQLRSLAHLSGYGSAAVSKAKQVMVVGDDFQAIYTFRGGDPEIFMKLDTWPGTSPKTLSLSVSQRSTKCVVESANRVALALAKQPKHRRLSNLADVELLPGRNDTGSSLPLRDHLLTKLVLSCVAQKRNVRIVSYKNSTADEVINRLHEQGIKEAVKLGRKTRTERGVRLFMAALTTMALTPTFRSLWVLWTVVQARVSGQHAKRVFRETWRQVKKSSPDEYLNALRQLGLPGKSIETVVRTCEPTPEGIEKALFVMKPVLPAEDWTACQRAAVVLAESIESEDVALAQAVSEFTRRDYIKALNQGSLVAATTVHQFKGLESDAVIVLDDFISSSGRMNPGEKLRLEYVARTRARDYLWVVSESEDVRRSFLVDHSEPCPSETEIDNQTQQESDEMPKNGSITVNGVTIPLESEPPSGESGQRPTRTREPVTFQWKDSTRTIPSPDDPLVASPPHRALVRDLLNHAWDQCVTTVTYGTVTEKMGLRNIKALVDMLGDVQPWCAQNKLFDLTALIVGKSSGVPGKGHYRSDCANEREWRAYMEAARRCVCP